MIPTFDTHGNDGMVTSTQCYLLVTMKPMMCEQLLCRTPIFRKPLQHFANKPKEQPLIFAVQGSNCVR
jgi:hypothetical protein